MMTMMMVEAVVPLSVVNVESTIRNGSAMAKTFT